MCNARLRRRELPRWVDRERGRERQAADTTDGAERTGSGSANSARDVSSAATGVAGSASVRAAQPATSQRVIRVKKNSAGRPVPSNR